ncbi:Gp37-like protein [Salininema proteolyticum]|uniref:Gp28/Gp37-like domain-containing protein n=1 Tax=Salininema proteolyticum TaxID=1607685 RepID=A0ABV8TTT3_9ACTN
MSTNPFTLEIRTKDLDRIATLPASATWTVDMEIGTVGSWEIRLPIEEPAAKALQTPGAGIILTGPTGPVFSGPATNHQYEATTTDPHGILIIEGTSDLVHLHDRLVWPKPANPVTDQAGVWRSEGHTSDVIANLVDRNAGAGARSERRVRALTIAPVDAFGVDDVAVARFHNLFGLLVELAAKGDTVFALTQIDRELVFTQWAPDDRSATIRWSLASNDLSGTRAAITAPSTTFPVVTYEFTPPDAKNAKETTADVPILASTKKVETLWGRRIEKTESTGAGNTKEGEAIDAPAIAKGIERQRTEAITGIVAEAIPLEGALTNLALPLGTKVAVDIDGVETPAAITGYTLTADDKGFRIEAKVGDAARLHPAQWLGRRIADLAERLTRLERGHPR